MPIVEAGILESLKGFIHKELHLPYLFSGSTNKTSENKDFRKQFRILIGDLEPVAAEQDVAPTQPEKTEFEKTLEEPDKVRGHEAFVRQKQDFIRSPQGFPAAEKEFKRLTEIAEPDLELIRQKDVGLSHEVVDNGHTLIVRAGGFTLTIHVEKVGMYVNEQDIILFINRWKGNLNRQGYYPFEEYKPVLISKQKLIFDLDSAFRPCWLDKDTQHTSEHLVELSLTWLMKEIVSTRRASL